MFSGKVEIKVPITFSVCMDGLRGGGVNVVSQQSLMANSQRLWNIFEVFGVTDYLFEEFMFSLKSHRPHIS